MKETDLSAISSRAEAASEQIADIEKHWRQAHGKCREDNCPHIDIGLLLAALRDSRATVERMRSFLGSMHQGHRMNEVSKDCDACAALSGEAR